ncbi:phage integrase SAM-like domain-containing protein [Arthrobacter zhaoguopingii]|uniref:phage integrase SAM-like domain-containing protein n=1 Tax=Arthrobacter zhaoguopingii TaxID=2681491 RepID=UPI00135BCFC6|nr:phage integrase SAM-like domain-containing protein [Arthrobacter zhaoguopingii]
MPELLLGELEDVEDERVTRAQLYRIFESNPQQAGRLMTVAQAYQLEASGTPWPVSGDRTSTQPLCPTPRKLTASVFSDIPLAELTVKRWLELWLSAVEEEAQDDAAAEMYTGTDRKTLRETAAGMRAIVFAARRQQVTDYLLPQLEKHLLIHFTEADVEALGAMLSTIPGKRAATLSRSTLRSVMTHLKKALQAAYEKELIDSNPAKDFIRYLGIEPKSAEWWADYRRRYQARLDAADDADVE